MERLVHTRVVLFIWMVQNPRQHWQRHWENLSEYISAARRLRPQSQDPQEAEIW